MHTWYTVRTSKQSADKRVHPSDRSSTDHRFLLDDLDPSGQIDKFVICIIYVAHVAEWESCTTAVHDTAHASLVESVLDRSCTYLKTAGLGSI